MSKGLHDSSPYSVDVVDDDAREETFAEEERDVVEIKSNEDDRNVHISSSKEWDDSPVQIKNNSRRERSLSPDNRRRDQERDRGRSRENDKSFFLS